MRNGHEIIEIFLHCNLRVAYTVKSAHENFSSTKTITKILLNIIPAETTINLILCLFAQSDENLCNQIDQKEKCIK